jgi:CheY-like chemotaxis protein
VGSRVLIVEDSALVVTALRILLEDAGHAVSGAGTVREAVDAARRVRPDVMLLDLTLPDGDGLAVLGALRESGDVPPTTAALTGRDEPEVRERCLRAGCRAVLLKPVDTRRLVRDIADWVAAGPRSGSESPPA